MFLLSYNVFLSNNDISGKASSSDLSSVSTRVTTIENFVSRVNDSNNRTPVYYGDLNSINTVSVYTCPNCTNLPIANSWWYVMTFVSMNGDGWMVQVAYCLTTDKIAWRRQVASTWNPWMFIPYQTYVSGTTLYINV